MSDLFTVVGFARLHTLDNVHDVISFSEEDQGIEWQR